MPENRTAELASTARALVPEGKGILAADESTPTIAKRLASIGVASTEETRRAWRETLLATPGMEKFVSGVILYEETLRQRTSEGVPFADLLAQRGVLPGIKVDQGTTALALHPGETVTEGLDGLRQRLVAYRGLGARFTKWRAVLKIEAALPTRACREANAHALARYAALSQEEGLVPVVEPEVLMDGAHAIERCQEVTGEVLEAVFRHLAEQKVDLTAMLLKPNMVLAGASASRAPSVEEVAERTLDTLRRQVPPPVPGIVFLSGGQSDEEATARLNAMNRLGSAPWELSFSYGRALQGPALRAWAGAAAGVPRAQRAFLNRARLNSAARSGRYSPAMEGQAVSA